MEHKFPREADSHQVGQYVLHLLSDRPFVQTGFSNILSQIRLTAYSIFILVYFCQAISFLQMFRQMLILLPDICK
jgi:hypothetical protein